MSAEFGVWESNPFSIVRKVKVRCLLFDRDMQLWNPQNLPYYVNKYAIIREAEHDGLTGFDIVAFLDKKPRTLQPGEWLLVF